MSLNGQNANKTTYFYTVLSADMQANPTISSHVCITVSGSKLSNVLVKYEVLKCNFKTEFHVRAKYPKMIPSEELKLGAAVYMTLHKITTIENRKQQSCSQNKIEWIEGRSRA